MLEYHGVLSPPERMIQPKVFLSPSAEDWAISEPWRTNTGWPLVSTESFISLGFYPNQSFKNKVTQTWGLGLGDCASLLLSANSSKKEGGGTGRQKPDSSSSNGSDNDVVTEPAPSSPKPWLEPLWLGVGGGQNPPQASPSTPQIASLGAQPISSSRRLRHTERRKWERRAQERQGGGTMKAEVRGPWTPHPHPHPREG